MSINFRTDMAAEGLSRLSGGGDCLPDGVSFVSETVCALPVGRTVISTSAAAELLGMPCGCYYNLDVGALVRRDSQSFAAAASAAAELISRFSRSYPKGEVLVAALGNPDITPDAVGSLCASNIIVTRHLKLGDVPGFEAFRSVSLFRTGVLGTSGMESAEHIRTLCTQLHPAFVIAVDALAGSDFSHLCSSIQISDAGIAPGSGIGNDRKALSREYLGVPVISVGVPTVIDAANLCDSDRCAGMFVTPRNIDSAVRCISRVAAYGIDLALHRGLTVSDIDMLVG